MIYYTVMCSKKSIATADWFAPMSYGKGTEPSPEQLLMRGRATLFDSQQEAFDALGVTLKQAKAEGHNWPEKHTYSIVECGK